MIWRTLRNCNLYFLGLWRCVPFSNVLTTFDMFYCYSMSDIYNSFDKQRKFDVVMNYDDYMHMKQWIIYPFVQSAWPKLYATWFLQSLPSDLLCLFILDYLHIFIIFYEFCKWFYSLFRLACLFSMVLFI